MMIFLCDRAGKIHLVKEDTPPDRLASLMEGSFNILRTVFLFVLVDTPFWILEVLPMGIVPCIFWCLQAGDEELARKKRRLQFPREH